MHQQGPGRRKSLYTDSTHIKVKANKHRKALVTVEETPKEYMEELNAQIDLDRKILGKKPFDHDDDDQPPEGGSGKTQMKSLTDPDSGQQSRDGKPDGFHYSEHRTVDSKNNVIANVHVEPANINDITPMPTILKEIEDRLGYLPKYMGLDAGYHSAWIAHLLESNDIQGVIGYRRHTHITEHYGKYRFKFNWEYDVYTCPEKNRLYWKITTRQGCRQYFCDSKTCAACPRREGCFGESMKRRMAERHVHGLRFARMLGIQNMREQCFLTAAVQNIKRLVKAFSANFLLRCMIKAHVLLCNTWALLMVWALPSGRAALAG